MISLVLRTDLFVKDLFCLVSKGVDFDGICRCQFFDPQQQLISKYELNEKTYHSLLNF